MESWDDHEAGWDEQEDEQEDEWLLGTGSSTGLPTSRASRAPTQRSTEGSLHRSTSEHTHMSIWTRDREEGERQDELETQATQKALTDKNHRNPTQFLDKSASCKGLSFLKGNPNRDTGKGQRYL